jgi:hypothetical protein
VVCPGAIQRFVIANSGFRHFIEALSEPDPGRKAELVLLANSETGLHEQIRLQPYIANSMDAAVVHAFETANTRHYATAHLPTGQNHLEIRYRLPRARIRIQVT